MANYSFMELNRMLSEMLQQKETPYAEPVDIPFAEEASIPDAISLDPIGFDSQTGRLFYQGMKSGLIDPCITHAKSALCSSPISGSWLPPYSGCVSSIGTKLAAEFLCCGSPTFTDPHTGDVCWRDSQGNTCRVPNGVAYSRDSKTGDSVFFTQGFCGFMQITNPKEFMYPVKESK